MQKSNKFWKFAALVITAAIVSTVLPAASFAADGNSDGDAALVDVALGKTVTVSGEPYGNHPKAYAVDGDVNTAWFSHNVPTEQSGPSWIQVDLTTLEEIKKISLKWHTWYLVNKRLYSTYEYSIEISEDGIDYITMASGNTDQIDCEHVLPAGTAARYVKITSPNPMAVAALSVYSIPKLLPQSNPASPVIYTYDLDKLVTDFSSERERRGLMLALESIQGLVNRDTPQIFYKYTLPDSIGFVRNPTWILDMYKEKGYVTEEHEYDDPYQLINDFAAQGYANGLVVLDPQKDFTINVGANVAGVDNLVMAYPEMLGKIDLGVAKDLRDNNFATAYDGYQWTFDNYWDNQRHDVLSIAYYSDNNYYHMDYLIEFKIPVYWLPNDMEPDYSPELRALIEHIFYITPVNIPVIGFWAQSGQKLIIDDPDPSLVDVARGKPVTVSGLNKQSSRIAGDKAVDGDDATRFISEDEITPVGISDGIPGSYIIVDLGEATAFDQIKLAWDTWYSVTKHLFSNYEYSIDISDDGENYTNLASGSDPVGATGSDITVSEPVIPAGTTARYVKLSSPNPMSLTALKVLKTKPLVNVALGKTATGSDTYYGNHPASDAVDNNETTMWMSNNTDASSIVVDLGDSTEFNKISLTWNPWYSKTGPKFSEYEYSVAISDDNIIYTTVVDDEKTAVAANKTDLTVCEHDMPSGMEARYIKVFSPSPMALAEFKVLQYDNTANYVSASFGLGEYTGTQLAGTYAKMTLVDGSAANYSYHSGVQIETQKFEQKVQDIVDEEYDPNKIYVAITMTESGGTPGYYQYQYKYSQWDDGVRGTVPMTFTIAPAVRYLLPGVLEYMYETSTENDYFISSIGGMGYSYPLQGYGDNGCLDADGNVMSKDAIFEDYYTKNDAEQKALDLEMQMLYGSRTTYTEADYDFIRQYILPYASNTKAIVADMSRLDSMTPEASHNMLTEDVSIHHLMTKMPGFRTGPPYNTARDEEGVSWYVNEINEHAQGLHFMISTCYSWDFGPRRMQMVMERLKQINPDYEFVTLNQLDYLYKKWC